MAETFLKKAKANDFALDLKYPDDDPGVDRACKLIAAQLAALGDRVGKPIKLRLVPLSPYQLRQDILDRRYQMAYWHYDFPNALFSLWPLFDWQKEAMENGSNYLGYASDTALQELLDKAARYRDFADVKRLTHDIHVALHEHMPLIPLWQLEYHLAIHPSLTLGRVDPQRIFSTISEWKLR